MRHRLPSHAGHCTNLIAPGGYVPTASLTRQECCKAISTASLRTVSDIPHTNLIRNNLVSVADRLNEKSLINPHVRVNQATNLVTHLTGGIFADSHHLGALKAPRWWRVFQMFTERCNGMWR